MGKKGMRREVIGVERKKRQGDNRGKHDGKRQRSRGEERRADCKHKILQLSNCHRKL